MTSSGSGSAAVSLANVEQAIVEELKISADEAQAYVAIVKNGKMDAAALAAKLSWDEQHARSAAISLVNRGMVIEITSTEYESLHPRFAVTNRYRRRCGEDGIPFKKNLRVDNIGIVLERPYEDARTRRTK
ncbi:helix-turn-helix domain-containing protein [Nitrososphaera sp.]|uniref:helix-turn-helix domain-containing protein n=1 Tax=Nitrososphaera sp. TaxID=1971748 RepID=UPI00307DBF78